MTLPKRVQREYNTLQIDPPSFLSSISQDEDTSSWNLKVKGPEESFYEGHELEFVIEFTYEYPFKPPNVTCKSKVFHPRLTPEGKICCCMKAERWMPRFKAIHEVEQILKLLKNPYDDCETLPCVVSPDIQQLLEHDKEAFEIKLQQVASLLPLWRSKAKSARK
mmetsp:Transcript_77013/g.115863  ORF Transcript_77013/g.115863 Transcript_77013/m.115863 type:complete len:164 (-) Transcript_77013:23-514(-)